VFESPVVVFLAVLGIDEKNAGAFHDAAAYSPVLSKFVKLSQMLVIRRAVAAAEDGDVEYPTWQRTDGLACQPQSFLPYFVLVPDGLRDHPCICPFRAILTPRPPLPC
jgi:hypothetical protein